MSLNGVTPKMVLNHRAMAVSLNGVTPKMVFNGCVSECYLNRHESQLGGRLGVKHFRTHSFKSILNQFICLGSGLPLCMGIGIVFEGCNNQWKNPMLGATHITIANSHS